MTGTLDLLAFGAHPDDVEIGMAGTLLRHSKRGYNTGICDLTRAELSSNGTVPIRQAEARKASEILGLTKRINLEIPDRALQYSEKYLRKIVQILRHHCPKVVFLPYPLDRHPDHGNCTRLVEEALFSAAIGRYQVDGNHPAHRVKNVYYYFINGHASPHLTINISDHIEEKRACLQAYQSQFMVSGDEIRTPLNNGYLEMVEARDALFGKEVGVRFAEGFRLKRPVMVDDLLGEGIS